MQNINDMSGSELVAYHNTLIDQLGRGAKVNRFADRKTALKRIERVQQELEAKRPAKKIELEVDEPADATPTPHAKPKAKAAPAEPKAKKGKRTYRFVLKAKDEQKPPRDTTKRMIALKLLLQDGGTTFEEVLVATGWDKDPGGEKGKRTCYEAIRLLNIQHGYGLDHDVNDRVYAYVGKTSPVARENQKR